MTNKIQLIFLGCFVTSFIYPGSKKKHFENTVHLSCDMRGFCLFNNEILNSDSGMFDIYMEHSSCDMFDVFFEASYYYSNNFDVSVRNVNYLLKTNDSIYDPLNRIGLDMSRYYIDFSGFHLLLGLSKNMCVDRSAMILGNTKSKHVRTVDCDHVSVGIVAGINQDIFSSRVSGSYFQKENLTWFKTSAFDILFGWKLSKFVDSKFASIIASMMFLMQISPKSKVYGFNDRDYKPYINVVNLRRMNDASIFLDIKIFKKVADAFSLNFIFFGRFIVRNMADNMDIIHSSSTITDIKVLLEKFNMLGLGIGISYMS